MSIYTDIKPEDSYIFESLKSHIVDESKLEPIDFSLAVGPKLFGSANGMYGIKQSEHQKHSVREANLNKAVVKDKLGNISSVPIDDPRFISGELVGIAMGKVSVKDKTGKYFLVDSKDPKYISGELVGVVKGRKWKQKNPGKLKGTILVKDKTGHMCRVKLEDPRYLSGELIHFRKSF
jgi:hypothetical protein